MARSPSIAHTANRAGVRHLLVDHLRAVSELAAEFGRPLGASEGARWLGLWHDLGKFSSAFQTYLVECEEQSTTSGRGPDHKAAGTHLAAKHLSALALAIQGHHGGLHSVADLKNSLMRWNSDPSVVEALTRARQEIADLEPAQLVSLPPHLDASRRSAELFIRLLFSALVDADYLDTERHFDVSAAGHRHVDASMQELWDRMRADQEALMAGAVGTVNRARREIYEACVAAADAEPGVFTLTVPTGAGKTRSAMAFALRHAVRNGQRHVVVAVPLITVTEQTANVYREIFESNGPSNVVLEHHSGYDALRADAEYSRRSVWRRLASENWDAPIVVTTTVQLFESLFAARPAACRKLHRLARSVIILDEAQSLPPHLLTPILDVLQELSVNYGTTVLLSTATQPAFHAIPVFASVDSKEIVPDPDRYFRELKRVDYELWIQEPVPWRQVADAMKATPQSLVVVNTKRDAIRLLDALGEPDALHLSTSLCGAHRSAVLKEVRRRLRIGKPCRVVSTQVVEAGVDIDLPVVFRAIGPLDAIIQAAGRCNREGGPTRGRTVVFMPEPSASSMPGGAYKTGTDLTASLVMRGADLDDPATPTEYFRSLFELLGRETDRQDIQALREALDFPRVAEKFRMVDEHTVSVLVPWGEDRERRDAMLDAVASGDTNPRLALRKLQPYFVNLYTRQAERVSTLGLIDWVAPRLGRWLGDYDAIRGLLMQATDPDVLIV